MKFTSKLPTSKRYVLACGVFGVLVVLVVHIVLSKCATGALDILHVNTCCFD